MSLDDAPGPDIGHDRLRRSHFGNHLGTRRSDADDDAVGADSTEHGLLGARGHRGDGVAETLGVVAALYHD